MLKIVVKNKDADLSKLHQFLRELGFTQQQINESTKEKQ